MNDQNAQLPNSEEDVLNRAMKRMDPILQASLQRDQKRRRQKLLTIGVALMATVSLIALFAWGMMTAGANATARNQPDDKPALTPLERTEKSESLVTGGWKLRQAGKNDEACELFIQAVELDSRNENAWNGLGWSYFNRGELSKAQDAFEHCLKLSPKHPAALNGMGQLHLSKGDMKQAEKYLLRAAPKASAAWYGLAVIYLLQGDYEKAEKWIVKLEKDPEAQNNPLLKSMAEAAQSKQLDETLRQQITPVAPSSNEDAAKLSQKGWTLFQKGQAKSAEVAFREALAADPQTPGATNGLAFALLNLGKVDEAQPLFEKLLKDEPLHFGAMNGLARCYKEQGSTDKAIELWEKMETQMKNQVSAATTGLATTYVEQKEYDKALPYLKRLVKAQPDNTQFQKMLDEAAKEHSK